MLPFNRIKCSKDVLLDYSQEMQVICFTFLFFTNSSVFFFTKTFLKLGVSISFTNLHSSAAQIKVIKVCTHAAAGQHTITSMFHSHCDVDTVVVLARSSQPNMLHRIRSKQIYFGFYWPKEVLPTFIRQHFMFVWQSKILLFSCRFVFSSWTASSCSVLYTESMSIDWSTQLYR